MVTDADVTVAEDAGRASRAGMAAERAVRLVPGCGRGTGRGCGGRWGAGPVVVRVCGAVGWWGGFEL